MPKALDLIGQKFGKLTVIEKLNNNKHGQTMWLCKCDCGNYTNVIGTALTKNHTKSCGCFGNQQKRKNLNRKTHGLSKHKLHSIWASMKARCYNPNDKGYKNYGGRSIKVCQEWLDDFMNFYNWATNNGYSNGLSIDRIDNNKGYSPDNCRWATRKQQNCNTRQNIIIEYQGKKKCLTEWSEITKIDAKVLSYRLKNNWNVQEAFETPVRKIGKAKKVKCIETGEIFKSTKYAGEKFNIKVSDVAACCTGRQKSTHGYCFQYID